MQGENKTSEILRAQKKYSKNEIQQMNGQSTYIGAKLLTAKEILDPDRKLLLSALEETTLK